MTTINVHNMSIGGNHTGSRPGITAIPGLPAQPQHSDRTSDFLLSEILEGVGLVRELILNDQLPHFKASQDVKRRLVAAHGDPAIGRDVLLRVKERLYQEQIRAADAATQVVDVNRVDQNSGLSISFPTNFGSSDLGRDSSKLDHVPSRRILRHSLFESRARDNSSTNISGAQFEAWTSKLMTFDQTHDLVSEKFVGFDEGGVYHSNDASSFNENDYYSSLDETSDNDALRWPSLKRRRIEDGYESQPHKGSRPSAVDIYQDHTEALSESDDYNPPEVDPQYVDPQYSEDGEYDPMQIQPGMLTPLLLFP